MIGPGVVINPAVLDKEIQDFWCKLDVYLSINIVELLKKSHLQRDSKGRNYKEKNW